MRSIQIDRVLYIMTPPNMHKVTVESAVLQSHQCSMAFGGTLAILDSG